MTERFERSPLILKASGSSHCVLRIFQKTLCSSNWEFIPDFHQSFGMNEIIGCGPNVRHKPLTSGLYGHRASSYEVNLAAL